MNKNILMNILVILTFIVLVVVKEPLISYSPSTEFKGGAQDLNGDVATFYWNVWYFNKAIRSGENIFYSDYMFYPYGVNLFFTPYTPLNSLLTAPFYPQVGMVGCHNLTILFSYLFAALGMFLLARHICGNSFAAFIAGFYYAFSDYHHCQIQGPLESASIQWIPFFCLFFIKTLNNPNKKDALWTGLFLVLNGYTNYYYLLFCILFSCFYGFYVFIRKNKGIITVYRIKEHGPPRFFSTSLKKLFIPVLICSLLFLLLTLPISYSILSNQFGKNPNQIEISAANEISVQANVSDYIFPINQWDPSTESLDSTIFIMFSGSLFLIIALLERKKIPALYPWFVLLILFALLSFGYSFSITGEPLIPLPFFLCLSKLPVFGGIRAPVRFALMVILALSVIIALVITYFTQKEQSKSAILIRSIALLIIVESFIIHPPHYETLSFRPPYELKLLNQSVQNTVLEIPLGWQTANLKEYGIIDSQIIRFYQTYHNKKTFGGQYDRAPGDALDYFQQQYLFSDIVKVQVDQNTPNNSIKANMELLALCDVGNIVVYKHFFSPQTWLRIKNYLNKYTSSELICNTEKIAIFKVSPISLPAKFDLASHFPAMAFLGFKLHTSEGKPFLRTKNKATFLLKGNNIDHIILSHKPSYLPVEENFYINGQKIHSESLSTPIVSKIIMPDNLSPAINKLTLTYKSGIASQIELISCGFYAKGKSNVLVDGVPAIKTKRGHNIVILSPQGDVKYAVTFDIHKNPSEAQNLLILLNIVKKDDIFIDVVEDEGRQNLTPELIKEFMALGAKKIDKLGHRQSYIFISQNKSSIAEALANEKVKLHLPTGADIKQMQIIYKKSD